MTYRDPAVQVAVAERFVPLKLDLAADRAVVRPLNVVWTPTLLFADRRGVVSHEGINFLPPADFLDLLDVGEALVRLRWAEYDRALARLAAVTDRDPDSPSAPEALYWRGIVTYLKAGSAEAMAGVWDDLRRRFPRSIWAKRIP